MKSPPMSKESRRSDEQRGFQKAHVGRSYEGTASLLRRPLSALCFVNIPTAARSSTDTWTSSLERETFWLFDDFMTRITGETQNGRWRSAPGERIVSAGLLATAAR